MEKRKEKKRGERKEKRINLVGFYALSDSYSLRFS